MSNLAKWISFSLVLTGCSGVKFDDSKGGGGSGVTANADGSVSGAIDQPGSGNITPGGPGAALLPKLTFSSPACPHLTNCEIDFNLDKAYPQAVDFDWKTNDTLYETPHTPAYGQPGVHYISTSGHITFAAGQTTIKAYVQNINQNNYEIIIGVIINNCAYQQTAESCTDFFAP